MTSALLRNRVGKRSRMASCTAAEVAGFEVLLTTDKNMRYQQNLAGRKIAVVVLAQQQWPQLRAHIQRIVEAVNAATPGTYVEI